VPRHDPFTGLQLSELVEASSGKLDQQLVSSRRENKPTSPSGLDGPKDSGPPESDPQARPPSERAPANRLPDRPPAPSVRAFDLAEPALFNATYRYTEEELNALEDLKGEIHRDLDMKVNKNDLVRSALHMLLEDYQAKREKSYAIEKMRKRIR